MQPATDDSKPRPNARVYSLKQAAEALGISLRNLERQCLSGQIRSVLVTPRRRLVPTPKLTAFWPASGRVPNTRRPGVGSAGPKLEERFIQRQPQSSSKAESPKRSSRRLLPRIVRAAASSWLGLLGQRDRQVRTQARRPRRFQPIHRGMLPRHSRARCGRRPEVGAEMTRRKQPEAQLQRALVEHLRWGARGDTWWTHIPTGGWRSPIEAAIFKSLGVRAGSPDLLIIRAGQPLFLELKAPGRNLSPAQTECHDALRRAGATNAWAGPSCWIRAAAVIPDCGTVIGVGPSVSGKRGARLERERRGQPADGCPIHAIGASDLSLRLAGRQPRQGLSL